MPRPSQVHIDKALERISVAFMPQGLVWNEVSSVVPVQKESDRYFVYSKDNLRIPSTEWADGDVPNRSIWNLSNASYQTTRHALDDLVTDRIRNNADKAVRPDVDTTEGLTAQIQLRMEKDLFSLINTNANWAAATSIAAAGHWSLDTTASNPILDIDTATTSIRRRSGKMANCIVMGEPTFKVTKEHQSLVDRIKHTSAESIGPELMATLFNVDKVKVSRAVENSAEEDLSDSLTDLATDTVLVLYRETAPGLKKPSAFYTFQVTQFGSPFRVRRYRDDPREGDVIEVSTFYQHKIVASDCAYQIRDVIG